MASFRLREDAIDWLSAVQSRLANATIFDLYYFCAMAGLTSGRAEELRSASREMIDYFVADHKPFASFVLAMLVVAELQRSRIRLTEEHEVRILFRSLVTGNGGSGLTDEGMRRLNAYANGGYEFLASRCDQRPQNPEEFLRVFTQLLGEAAASGPFSGLDLV